TTRSASRLHISGQMIAVSDSECRPRRYTLVGRPPQIGARLASAVSLIPHFEALAYGRRSVTRDRGIPLGTTSVVMVSNVVMFSDRASNRQSMKQLGLWPLWCTLLLWVGCSFDTSPVLTNQPPVQSSVTDASVVESDASLSDAGQDAGSILTGNDAGTDAGVSPPVQVPNPPLPQFVTCGNVFCPLADAPVKACCTTQNDADRRLARKPGVCGVDMSALGDPAFGAGCWQRDQLGIVDDRCESAATEPGCCADDGQCGTNNADRHLGCRHAPGTKAAACGQSAPLDSCSVAGTYGIRITVDAAWNGRAEGLAALTDDGRGPIQTYLLTEIGAPDPVSHRLTASGRVCGVTLPPFYSSALCESYQPVFPNELWESVHVPVLSLVGQYGCGTDGCVMSLDPLTYVLGLHLDNPEAVWPSAEQTAKLRCPGLPGQQCFTDDDGDGEPGVRVDVLSRASVADRPTRYCTDGYSVRAPPLSASIGAIFGGVRRSDRLFLGIRARLGATFRFAENCQTGSGSAVADYVNSRATGCLVEPGSVDVAARTQMPAGKNDRCGDDEAHFIDLSMPEYQVLGAGVTPPESGWTRDTNPSFGPVASFVRFAPSATPVTCQDVRAALN
ncbi:MAG: hypothetical protein RL701_5251, partial [Pseudomonadota bacterium]